MGKENRCSLKKSTTMQHEIGNGDKVEHMNNHNIILYLADNLENISVKICSGKEAISTDTATLMKDAAMWLKQMYEDLEFAEPCFLCKEFKAEGIGCEILDGNARHPCEWKYIKLYSEGE